MKSVLAATILMIFNLTTYSQTNPTEEAQPIVAEGKRLYQSEMASWYGTDLFLEKYSDRSNIGGYFSYVENGVAKCVFFSKEDKPKVIGTIAFDSTYNTKTATTDLTERNFTAFENDIYTIRKIALAAINADTLFKSYPNTSLNLIPLIQGDDKKVYVLTGPRQNGVIIFGNDYLLRFDKSNQLVSKKQLHKNIIPIQVKEEDENESVGAMHSHLPETGEFMTATDICTLMLYSRFTKWKQHNVVSKKYLNIWNCETRQLTVIPMGALDKINQDQENSDKKRKRD